MVENQRVAYHKLRHLEDKLANKIHVEIVLITLFAWIYLYRTITANLWHVSNLILFISPDWPGNMDALTKWGR